MRTFSNRKNIPKKFYFINYQVPEGNLRVIDSAGKQIGVMSKQKALDLAKTSGLDLVLISPQANPPVVKVIDFKKFLYQENKKQKEEKKHHKKSLTKDLKLSLFIAEADFQRLVEKGKLFLEQGHQLRINLALKGRENMKKDLAFELINKFITSLGFVNITKNPRLEGSVIRAVVTRKK